MGDIELIKYVHLLHLYRFYYIFVDSDFDFYIELSHEPLYAKPAVIIGKAMSLLRHSGHFTNFLPISHARVPILKCYHIRTGYQCDINFSDSYGILNSPIVARLLTFDARIYVLATILKFWTKVHDCAGKNRISNYAIVWMLIYYLQQLPVPIVPPIIEFQKRVHPYFVNNYNFAFDDRVVNNNTSDVRCSDLLKGFFSFYRDFDYESNVICPLYGKAFRKADILSNKLPEFHRYHELLHLNPTLTHLQFNKCICIQDPFEITYSLPGVIPHMEFKKILAKFEYANAIIDSELKSSGESARLMLSLFDAEKFNQYALQHSKNQPKESNQQSVVSKTSNTKYKNALEISPNDYHLSIVRDILWKQQTKPEKIKIDSHSIYRSWSEHVATFIILILRDIFMLTITANENEATISNTDNFNDDNVHKLLKIDSQGISASFDVLGSRDVFLGRKQSKKIHVHSLNAEILDSKERFKNVALEIQLKANITITSTDKFDGLKVEFNDLIKTKKNNFFKSFLTNFDQSINNLLKVYFVHKNG